MEAQLKALVDKDDGFTLLLSHRPELFDVYVTCNADLVLSAMRTAVSSACRLWAVWRLRIRGCFRNMTRDCFPREKRKCLSAAA